MDLNRLYILIIIQFIYTWFLKNRFAVLTSGGGFRGDLRSMATSGLSFGRLF